jgi:hypothetical protein
MKSTELPEKNSGSCSLDRIVRSMIAIVNIGPHDDPNPLGERTYEVRINRNVITTFKHKRGDGLGPCLLEASKAVERQKWMEVESFISANDRSHLSLPVADSVPVERSGASTECDAGGD